MKPRPGSTVETVRDFWQAHINNEYYTYGRGAGALVARQAPPVARQPPPGKAMP